MTARHRVWLVVGKPPRPGTLMAQVGEGLRRAGADVEVRLPHDDPAALDGEPPDLLVHRGLRADVLAELRRLETAGVTCCNPVGAAGLAEDRAQVVVALGRAGVPVPAGAREVDWAQVRRLVRQGPRVVKAAEDPTGRSARVALLGDDSAEPPFPGPWLVQQPVGGDGVDRKLYVVGAQVQGLLKPGPLGPVAGATVTPFVPDEQLRLLALRVGDVLGLHVYGVDAVVSPEGPVVVDVNVMPGFRGVDAAAGRVVDHLLAHLPDPPGG